MNPFLARRISASLLDTCLYLLMVGLGYGLVLMLPFSGEVSAEPALQALLLLWPVLPLSLIESRSGQSPGKQATSLVLTNTAEDRTPGLIRLLLRNLIKIPMLGLGIASFVYLLLSQMTNMDTFWTYASLAYFLCLPLLNAGIVTGSAARSGKSLYDLIFATQVDPLDEYRPMSRWIAWPAVAVLSLIMILIALPNFIGACACGSLTTVKSNMHTMQTIVETYAVDWGGQYPPNLETLKTEASQPKLDYWREIRNPFPLKIKEKTLFWEHEVTREELPGAGYAYFNEGQKIVPGAVSYAVSADQTRYWIYGYTDKGQRIQNKNAVFFLTNS